MKTVEKISLLCIIILCTAILVGNKPINESVQYKRVAIGSVKEIPEGLLASQHLYPLFEVGKDKYVALYHLKMMGITWTEEKGIIYLKSLGDKRLESTYALRFDNELAHMHVLPIYCGPIRSYCLEVKQELLIPLEALQEIVEICTYQSLMALTPKINGELNHLQVGERLISNLSDHMVVLSLRHLFFQRGEFLEEKERIYLEPGDCYQKHIILKANQIYVTTFITPEHLYDVPMLTYGQKNKDLFKKYMEGVRGESLEKFFPVHRIDASLKYQVGKLQAKEEVELWRSEKRAYYTIKDKTGKKLQVPYDSLHIIGERGGSGKKVTAEDIEDFINYKQLTSSTPYLLWTDVYRQRIYVLKQTEEGWHLEKSFICSSGKNNNPTPTGLYKVQYSFPYFGLEKGYRCKNALVFYKDYMFHSILFDRTGKYIKTGQYDLGRRVSHGCVRLSEEDSTWLYKHIPVGTTVWIR